MALTFEDRLRTVRTWHAVGAILGEQNITRASTKISFRRMRLQPGVLTASLVADSTLKLTGNRDDHGDDNKNFHSEP